jgi:predicted phosphodiesterase
MELPPEQGSPDLHDGRGRSTVKVGIISDTHGLLRPEAVVALQVCERIIHAGDIGKGKIVQQLFAIASMQVVSGNNDVGRASIHWPRCCISSSKANAMRVCRQRGAEPLD